MCRVGEKVGRHRASNKRHYLSNLEIKTMNFNGMREFSLTECDRLIWNWCVTVLHIVYTTDIRVLCQDMTHQSRTNRSYTNNGILWISCEPEKKTSVTSASYEKERSALIMSSQTIWPIFQQIIVLFAERLFPNTILGLPHEYLCRRKKSARCSEMEGGDEVEASLSFL